MQNQGLQAGAGELERRGLHGIVLLELEPKFLIHVSAAAHDNTDGRQLLLNP